jgi:transposase
MTKQNVHLGLDVAKLKIDVCLLLPDKGTRQKMVISNSLEGFHTLLKWLGAHQVDLSTIHAGFEPTGNYSNALGYFLHEQGIKMSRVHSFAVLNHRRSQKLRSKNDKIDAYLLADFVRKNDPPLWEPPTKIQSDLKELQHRLASIDEAIRQEKSRLEAGVACAAVQADIEESLGNLIARQIKLEKALQVLVQSDDRLTEDFKILDSIIGIGEKSALRMLALVQFEKFRSGRQVGCFAGLSPREEQSGSSVKGKEVISKIGSSELRAALYFPAMVAKQHNPQLREFAERLEAKGKPKKVIICAIMRKLLVLAHTLLSRRKFYDANYQSLNPA